LHSRCHAFIFVTVYYFSFLVRVESVRFHQNLIQI
jgi:hypothetical protein